MTLSNGSARCDEYLEVLDHPRADYPPSFDVTHSSKDLIVCLVNLEFVQTDHHLFHLFKLCCVCATSKSTSYPAVTVGTISTLGHQSRFTYVILPGQSFLSSVPGSIAFCSSESNLNSFFLLSASFGHSATSPSSDPCCFWTT